MILWLSYTWRGRAGRKGTSDEEEGDPKREGGGVGEGDGEVGGITAVNHLNGASPRHPGGANKQRVIRGGKWRRPEVIW